MTEEVQAPTIYNYDRTFEFTGDSYARKNPLDEGFLIPGNATLTAPPPFIQGYARVWNPMTNRWVQTEDHRGKTLYSKETGAPVIVELLGPLDESLTDIEPTFGQVWVNDSWVYSRETLVQCAVKERNRHALEYLYKGVIIKLDAGQRADLGSLFTAYIAQQLPQDYVLHWSEAGYEDSNNSTITISYAELPGFCLGALQTRQKAFSVFPLILANIATYTSPEEVIEAYTNAMQS